MKQLETLLKKEKHFKGAPDNKFDTETATALKAWQKRKRVQQTGRVDSKTRKALTKTRKNY